MWSYCPASIYRGNIEETSRKSVISKCGFAVHDRCISFQAYLFTFLQFRYKDLGTYYKYAKKRTCIYSDDLSISTNYL